MKKTPVGVVRAFTIQKAGNTDVENEDRYSLRTKSHLLLALSDGATESAYSREWADLLVKSNGKYALLGDSSDGASSLAENRVSAWITPLRQQFLDAQASREMSWYAREKARRGAHAAFLAWRVRTDGSWNAVSCGDVCLISVREGAVEWSLPLRHPEDFTNQPSLISSRLDRPLPNLSVHRGDLGSGDEAIVLATDALACWMLDKHETCERVSRLMSCDTQTEFEGLVADQRIRRKMKNDDTTALIFRRQSQVV